uniref:Putative ovule protein n=1 Tax=Solanum chacoense TaxID=4108 RepID=A0A0V0GVP1_SOLCH
MVFTFSNEVNDTSSPGAELCTVMSGCPVGQSSGQIFFILIYILFWAPSKLMETHSIVARNCTRLNPYDYIYYLFY